MTRPITVETTIHFRRRGRGSRREIASGASLAAPQQSIGRVPRISRLMALAIRLEQLIRTGEIADYAELARLGRVSRARITQIMNLVSVRRNTWGRVPTGGAWRGWGSIRLAASGGAAGREALPRWRRGAWRAGG